MYVEFTKLCPFFEMFCTLNLHNYVHYLKKNLYNYTFYEKVCTLNVQNSVCSLKIVYVECIKMCHLMYKIVYII